MNAAKKQERAAPAPRARVALVVGASSGIGEATARHLAKQGWIVYGAARRIERLHAVGGTLRALKMDVQDTASIARGVRQVLGAEGRIDALVNCAGWGSVGALEETPLEEARRMFDVNVFGLAAVMQQVLPSMRSQGYGHIVNVASIAGRMAFPMAAWYVASKHAVVGLSSAAAYELNQCGIEIALVEPGAVHSEFSAGLAGDERPGPYRALLACCRRFADAQYRKHGVGPELIARTVASILNDPKPRLHYVAPAYARRDLLVAALLPARTLRRLVNWMAGIGAPGRRAPAAPGTAIGNTLD